MLFKQFKSTGRDGNSKNPILLTTTKELLQSKVVTTKYLNSSSNLFQNFSSLTSESLTSITFDYVKFLKSHNIEFDELRPDLPLEKVLLFQGIRTVILHFESETSKLNNFCLSYRLRVLKTLQEQSYYRIVTKEEVSLRLFEINNQFASVFQSMMDSFCKAIITLQKKFIPNAPKRAFLGRKVTMKLNEWFYSHLNDPYPSEDEKKQLADSCGITIKQVNYWFGNRRNRYKKKLEKKGGSLLTHSPPSQ